MGDRYASTKLTTPAYDGMPSSSVPYSSPFIGVSTYAKKTVDNGNYASIRYTDEAAADSVAANAVTYQGQPVTYNGVGVTYG